MGKIANGQLVWLRSPVEHCSAPLIEANKLIHPKRFRFMQAFYTVVVGMLYTKNILFTIRRVAQYKQLFWLNRWLADSHMKSSVFNSMQHFSV